VTNAAPEFPSLLPAALTTPTGPGALPRRSTRDWLTDGSCFLLALGWTALIVGSRLNATGAGRHPLWMVVLDGSVGLLAAFGLWLRRRWPVTVAMAVTVPTATLLGSSVVAFLIMMFTVAVHRRVAVTVAVSVVGTAANLVAIRLNANDDTDFWILALILVVAVASVVAWGVLVRFRRQLVVSLRDQADHAESEQRLRVVRARQGERIRIAREMHDVLADRIGLLGMHAAALERVADGRPEEVVRAAGVIRGSAHAALQDLRQVIGVLRAGTPDAGPDLPSTSGPLPSLVDVPALVAEHRAAGMRVDLRDQVTGPGGAPEPVGRAAYRVVQEGLTNARRHAPGAAVTVDLVGGPGRGLTVTVRNQVPAGRPRVDRTGPAGPGTALVGVAERVALAGGRAEHGYDDNGDHRLTATLPWPASQDHP
jgi:signal transduction histidine kinase